MNAIDTSQLLLYSDLARTSRKRRRIVLLSTSNTRHDVIVEAGERAEINVEDVARRPWDYKYKTQTVVNKVWRDQRPLRPLVSDEKIRVLILSRSDDTYAFAVDIVASTLRNDPSDERIRSLRAAVHSLVNTLWVNGGRRHKNAHAVFSSLESVGPELNSRLMNISFYMRVYIELKWLFEDFDASTLNFANIAACEVPEQFLEALRAYACEAERRAAELQLAGVLAGQLWSVLGSRDRAEALFERNSSRSAGVISSFDSGLYTFSAHAEKTDLVIDSLTFESRPSEGSSPVVVFSVDVGFLRLYGMQLLFYSAALKNVAMHFHVVGPTNDTYTWIKAAKQQFAEMLAFRGTTSVATPPSFSYEEVPSFVAEPKTYYACSRIIRAACFIREFDRPLYILDADMTLLKDPRPYFRRLVRSGKDVGLVFPSGVVSMVPWRRVMAGNVYLRGGSESVKFIEMAADYCLGHLDRSRSWMLDQNALSFAYENFAGSTFRIGDRPFMQASFRADLESS